MSTNPNARPISGETASAIRTPKTPTGRQPFSPPHSTAPIPPSTSAAPTRPPTSACAELDGNPRHQVRRFQRTAPSAPEPITTTASAPETVTIPAIVSATAVPTRSAPNMLKTADSTTACPGRAPRVATSVAIAFAASWKPFVSANASANETANHESHGSIICSTPHWASESSRPRRRRNRRGGVPAAAPAPRFGGLFGMPLGPVRSRAGGVCGRAGRRRCSSCVASRLIAQTAR